MPITARCPACETEFRRPDSLGGKLEKCPKCRHVFRLPVPLPEEESGLLTAATSRTDGAPADSLQLSPDRHDLIQQVSWSSDSPPAAMAAAGSYRVQRDAADKGSARAPRVGKERETRSALYLSLVAAVAVILATGGILLFSRHYGESQRSGNSEVKHDASVELERPVVGVNSSAEVFEDQELRKKSMTLVEGTPLTVLSTEGELLRIRVRSGEEGWMRRFLVCTMSEYERRKAKDQVPENVLCVKLEDGKTAVYGGQVSIENGAMVVKAGDSFWTDPTTEGKTFPLGRGYVTGDPSVLFFMPKNGTAVSLPIWKKTTWTDSAGSKNPIRTK